VEDDAVFRVAGSVVSTADHLPIFGLKVHAFDRDFFREQPLGVDSTDEAGHYEIRFSRSAFSGPVLQLERAPDIFVQVLDPDGHTLVITPDSVIVDAAADVRLDLCVDYPSGKSGGPTLGVVAGRRVDLAAAAGLSIDDLMAALRHDRGMTVKFEREDLVRRALPWLFQPSGPQDDCGLGRRQAIVSMLEERGIETADIDTSDDLPSGAAINWFYTANIRVKYTTDSAYPQHRVDPATPTSDTPFTLPNGGPTVGTLRATLTGMDPANTVVAPTYVQKVGLLAEYALSRFLGAPYGFRDPRNGAARLEYRILQQPAGVVGQTSSSWSHVEVGPTNSDNQNAGTVPHEMFHQIQFRYSPSLATGPAACSWAVLEGGARMIEDSISDPRNRYVVQAGDIFGAPGNSLLDVGGVQNPIRYAFALLWKYIAEQHSTLVAPGDEPGIGVDAHRVMLERMATAQATDPGIGYTTAALRDARARLPWYGTLDQFAYYDAARRELNSHETTWGNYLVGNWLHGAANPTADKRFDYMEDEDPVGYDGTGAAGRLATKSPALLPGDTVTIGQGTSVTRNVTGHNPWAARYYELIPGSPAPRMVRVAFTASGGMSDPLLQILRLGPGSTLVDIHRSDATTYAKTINMSGLERVIVIVGSRDNGGAYTLQVEETASASDVMVTRWNTASGSEYEIDPRGWSWTWVSPDVMVDTNDDAIRDTEVLFGQNNKLKVRLRNRGNSDASNLTIRFWYQKATPYLTAGGWIPVEDAAHTVQQVTGGTLLAGETKWFSVNWAPVDDGTNHPHWCVKVEVTAPGDPNTDNKLALSNFGNVHAGTGDVLDVLLRYPEVWQAGRLDIVPRGPKWTFAAERVPRPSKTGVVTSHCACGPAIVAVIPDRAALATVRLRAAELVPWDRATRLPAPVEGTYYPVDPASLPPGVESDHLVTVAHWVDGHVVGGVTYELID